MSEVSVFLQAPSLKERQKSLAGRVPWRTRALASGGNRCGCVPSTGRSGLVGRRRSFGNASLARSLLTEADAGHTEFTDEVYQNEGRYPGGDWKPAEDTYTDAVSWLLPTDSLKPSLGRDLRIHRPQGAASPPLLLHLVLTLGRSYARTSDYFLRKRHGSV